MDNTLCGEQPPARSFPSFGGLVGFCAMSMLKHVGEFKSLLTLCVI